MTSFFVSAEPVTHALTDPDTGENATLEDGTVATVSIRPLTAADQVAIQDSIAMEQTGSGDVEVSAKIGTIRRRLVDRLLVEWNLPLALTPNTLDKLDPRIYDQIAELCSSTEVGSSPLEPNSSESKPSS